MGEDAYAITSVNGPNNKTEMINTIFRPNLSEEGPATRAPMTRPKGAALITMPKAGLDMSHSCSIEGATKPREGHIHAIRDDDQKTHDKQKSLKR